MTTILLTLNSADYKPIFNYSSYIEIDSCNVLYMIPGKLSKAHEQYLEADKNVIAFRYNCEEL